MHISFEEDSKHILVRYSNKVHKINVIKEHVNAIKEHGYIWYGKYGGKVAASKVKSIVKNHGFIFMVCRVAREYLVYVAKILAFSQEMPKDQIYPEYYEEHIEHFNSWFKIDSLYKMKSSDMFNYFTVASSVGPLIESISTSMQTRFYLRCLEDADIEVEELA